MSLASGTRLGPYEILAPLGAGGMGEVYRARDTRLGRDVALKVLPAELANDASRRQRFELEARAVAALNHPNIVAIHDVGADGGVSYIITELVDGGPLRGGKLGLRKTLDIAVQIANGLAAAHAAGITHRDLKPDNILLTRDGRVKILDFGLAKVRAAQTHAGTETVTAHTEPGVVMGTVGYMSPEQVRGQEADYRSDIFSFGVILYEMLAAKRAFQGETSVDTMQAILRQEPPDLPDTVPSAVRQVVSHCLEKDPANRFQSARDLGFALSAMAQSGSHTATVALPAQRLEWRVPKAVLLGLAALALIAIGAVGARFWLRAPASPAWTGVLLGGPELAESPRLAPDGHMLAFVAAVDDVWQVGVMKPQSGNWVMLTQSADKGYCASLSWSPDGTRIYYDRWTDVPRGIYSVPVLGGAEQLVLEDAASPEALPDGSLLVERFNSERQMQMFRFWPETGRLQAFPLETFGPRAFPDGREAVAVGTLIGKGREAGQHVYLVDLASGSVRRFLPLSQDDSKSFIVAVTHDGKSVLVGTTKGNLVTIAAVAKNGHTVVPTLLSLTGNVLSLDSGADGSIYLDQSERPTDLLRFPAHGGHAERIAGLPDYETPGSPNFYDEAFAVLPDGRTVFTQGTGGRMRLMVVEAGKGAVPLINTAEETSAPATAAGPSEIAFLIGPAPRTTIALAATSNGRLVRRIPFNKGPIISLAASPDGKMLYCAAGGNVWSIPAAGGEAKKIRAGDHVAVDPSGQYLVVQVTENPIIRLIRMPLEGGPEQEISRAGPQRPALFIGPNAIGKDGRILMPLGASTWYWPPGVLDPSTGQFSRIPVDSMLDYHALGWAPDGNVMALGLGMRVRMWKFQPGQYF